MKTRLSRTAVLLWTLFFNLPFSTWATSDLISYQGKLTAADGSALPAGSYWLGIRVWDVATGGTTPLWARKYQTPVTDGLFSLLVGATGTAWDAPTPLTTSLKLATSGPQRWIEITVMSDANGAEKPSSEWTVLLPRQSLASVPYAMNGTPTGSVIAFAGTLAPEGWALCDGTPRSKTDPRFKPLFDVIGITYGQPTASDYSLPDLRGRTVIGTGQGASLTNRSLAQTMGTETHTLSINEIPSHTHSGTTSTAGAHTHTVALKDDGSGGEGAAESGNGGSDGNATTSSAGSHSHTFTTNATGGGVAHNIMQPTLVLNYLIKL